MLRQSENELLGEDPWGQREQSGFGAFIASRHPGDPFGPNGGNGANGRNGNGSVPGYGPRGNGSFQGSGSFQGYGPPPSRSGPGAGPVPPQRRGGYSLPQSPKAKARRRRAALMALVLVVVMVGGLLFAITGGPSVAVPGLSDGATVNPGVLAKPVRIKVPDGKAAKSTLSVDGKTMPTRAEGNNLVWDGAELGDGDHSLVVTVPGLLGASKSSYDFKVDAVPPRVDMPNPMPQAVLKQKLAFDVGVPEKNTTVAINGRQYPVNNGKAHIEFDTPPANTVLEARDPAGNVTRMPLTMGVSHPDIRGVHVRGVDWADPKKRAEYLRLLDEKRINVIQLDIKDEAGEVQYDSKVPQAVEAKVVKQHYVAREAIDTIHQHGGRVVGRVVAFADPAMSNYRYKKGEKDWALQAPDGSMFGKYGGFLSYANPTVQRYVLDVAKEGASLGFDEILWDYMRRPEGDPASMKVPGLGDQKSSEVIANFLGMAQGELRQYGAYVGVSVFGIAASRPESIAQDIPSIAKHVDYVAPMVYPSHWGKGEYNVADPNRQPYDIVKNSMKDFQKAVNGSNAKLVLWTQDFSDKGVKYGEPQVRAQIQAINEIGVSSFILWNAGGTYTGSALDPKP